MCKGLTMVVVLSLSLCVFCQEKCLEGGLAGTLDCNVNHEILHSTTFGLFGIPTVYDSYLSPYAFCDGVDFRVQRETARMTNLWDGHVSNQSFVDVNLSSDLMSDGSPSWYSAGIRYNQGWLYNFGESNIVNPVERSARTWHFAAGLQASGFIGGVYLDRAGNNPGQARANLMLNATGVVSCVMFRKTRPVVASYQLTFPLAGVAFSPNYGQSYYEIFGLGNYDHNVVFANTFNMPSHRHRLMLDVPFKKLTLRAGYDIQINQSKFNGITHCNYTCDFLLGFSKYFYRR